MKRIVLFFTLASIAILFSSCTDVHQERLAKIDELQWEALDSDTVKFAGTQGAIDSLLKRVDKEYAITDDHETRMNLIDERQELERADRLNYTKSLLIRVKRIQRELSSFRHEDPGRKS